MTPALNLREYVASGYFLSRHVGVRDCTGIDLRRITLASDHSQRRFFPDSWALSWCNTSRDEQVAGAACFGIAEADLDQVIEWADRAFDTAFGAWSVLYSRDDAHAAAHSLLRNATDVELWGVGLHQSLVSSYCEASKPPSPRPGYAPVGPSGIHVATCSRPAPLADGGVALGHEILIADGGCCFNSPESRHLDEQELFRAVGVMPNGHGLIDSLDEAISCCRYLDSHAPETQHRVTGWRPWLIVRYPL